MTNWWNRNRPGLETVAIILTIGLFCIAVFIMFGGKVHAATVNLAWQANTESDLAGYRLYRADTSCAQAGTTAFRPVKTVQLVTFISDVVGKGTYCYRLTAFDVAGNESAPSVKRQVTIINDSAPSGFVVHSVAP